MVDPTKPYNTLSRLPPKEVTLESVENLKLCIQASRALSRLDRQTSTTFRNFAKAINIIKLFSGPEAVPSSAVENIITTVADALQARALPEEKLPAAIKETGKYTEAIALGSTILHKKAFLQQTTTSQYKKHSRFRKRALESLRATRLPMTKRVKYITHPPKESC